MPKLINKATYPVTVVDVMLAPGRPVDVSEEVYNNPSVQAMLAERVPGTDDFVLSVYQGEEGDDVAEDEETDENEGKESEEG